MKSVYPETMQKSVELVERTRDKRIGMTFKRITPEERDELLQRYHPDYKIKEKRPLKIGPNKGDVWPHEVVDLLEAHPLINPNDIDLTKLDYDVDILIIGGGGAGMAAAWWAIHSGMKPENLLIVTKLRLGDSNSCMSQGGMQVAEKPNDSISLHYLDTIGGGHYANKPELVKALVSEAPLILKWHEELGINYNRNSDGTFQVKKLAGETVPRCHFAKDYTGMEIVRNFKDAVLNLGTPVLEFTSAVELIMDDLGQVAGAVLYNMETGEYYVARAKSTILATGGFGRLHIQGFPTTNHYGATFDGVVLAYHVGAKLRDLDATQYHPTGCAYPEAIVGLLITEKMRGFGAQLCNKYGEAFFYPLEPRDVVSAAIIRECYGRDNGVETPTGMRGVWLDTPIVDVINGKGTLEKQFPAIMRQYSRFNIDFREVPILVFPTLHYMNGGIEINVRTETSVPGLFAAGEVSSGVHGKNRLGGNSILDYNVFGRRAGIFAAQRAKKAKIGKLNLDHVIQYERMLEEAGIKTNRKSPILLPEYRGKHVLSRALDIL